MWKNLTQRGWNFIRCLGTFVSLFSLQKNIEVRFFFRGNIHSNMEKLGKILVCLQKNSEIQWWCLYFCKIVIYNKIENFDICNIYSSIWWEMNIQMIVFLYQFIHQEVFLKVSNLYACSIYYVEQCLGLNGRMNKKISKHRIWKTCTTTQVDCWKSS